MHVSIKTPTDQFRRADEAHHVCLGAKATRFEKGLFLVTGQTFGRIVISVDVRNLIEEYLTELMERNPSRGLMLIGRLGGRRLSSYSHRQRERVLEDAETLAARLRVGGYFCE